MTLPANAMSEPVPHPLDPVPIVLVRKLILLGLVMIVAALGLVLLLRQIHIYSVILPHILSDASMGLIAGFSARWVLRNQTAVLRITSILTFLIGGLELLGWFTGWQIGLGPLRSGLPRVDWSSLGQLLLGTGISLLALYAWTQPAKAPIQPILAPVQPTPAIVQPTPAAIQPIPAPVQPAPVPKSTKSSSRTRQQVVKRPPRCPSRSRVRRKPAPLAEQPVEPKRKRLSKRNPHLQLSDEVEHRCPYCLELIEPEDSRGTVECKICHTLHHADCWAITGACQVPHFTV